MILIVIMAAISLIILALLYGLSLSFLWSSLVAPSLGLPELSTTAAIGIALIYLTFLNANDNQHKERSFYDLIDVIASEVVKLILINATGWAALTLL